MSATRNEALYNLLKDKNVVSLLWNEIVRENRVRIGVRIGVIFFGSVKKKFFLSMKEAAILHTNYKYVPLTESKISNSSCNFHLPNHPGLHLSPHYP